jgi:hypothetical protein
MSSLMLTAAPTAGRMIQGFGPRPKPTPTSPAIHYGQDWGWSETRTDPIYAAAPGKVIAYTMFGAYGRRMVVEHETGVQTWYCHTSSASVPVGAPVKAGQEIARIGMTGNTTGPHLHFEVRIGGVAVDPAPYFDLSGTAGDGGLIPIPEPETNGLIPMPDISIVLDLPNTSAQIALGPRGEVHLDGQTADLLNRWLQWQKAGGDVSKAGGMTRAERDILRGKVLSKIA